MSNYSLHELDLSCAEDYDIHGVGSFANPLGVKLWPGKDGMAYVVAGKRMLIFGRLALRALNIRGWFDPDARAALFEPGGPPSFGAFVFRWLYLLVWGVPFVTVGESIEVIPTGDRYTLTIHESGE